jgi:hypothetical protein
MHSVPIKLSSFLFPYFTLFVLGFHQSYVVVLWVSWILTYFAYLQSGKILQMAQLQCDELNFGCLLAQGIVNWFIIMFQLR